MTTSTFRPWRATSPTSAGGWSFEAVFPDLRVNLLRSSQDSALNREDDGPLGATDHQEDSDDADSAAADGVDDLDPVAGRELG